MKWNPDVSVWTAVNDDIPIALESNSFDALVERVKMAAPELLELNGMNSECALVFVSDRREEVA
jgi:hypothetical protein